jgi:2'-5' RNA ligase
MPDSIRAFVALEIPEPLRAPLDALRAELRRQLGDIPLRWPTLENIHLTLKFLGAIAPVDVPRIQSALESAAQSTPAFEISLGGLGVFPQPNQPRVVWIGVGGSSELPKLKTRIEEQCAALGFPPEGRPFSPHLTLARVQRAARQGDYERIASALALQLNTELGVAAVDGVSLFRSKLTPQGASYSRLYGVQFNTILKGD